MSAASIRGALFIFLALQCRQQLRLHADPRTYALALIPGLLMLVFNALVTIDALKAVVWWLPARKQGTRAMRQEATTGSIEVGKLADLIVLDRDITAIPATQIAATQVLLTLLGGAEVWRSSGAILQPTLPVPPSVPSMGEWSQLFLVAAIGTLVYRCWKR